MGRWRSSEAHDGDEGDDDGDGKKLQCVVFIRRSRRRFSAYGYLA